MNMKDNSNVKYRVICVKDEYYNISTIPLQYNQCESLLLLYGSEYEHMYIIQEEDYQRIRVELRDVKLNEILK